MTCSEFFALASGNREYAALTRAERAAMEGHLVECRTCLRLYAGEMAKFLRDKPREAVEAIATGMKCRNADLAASDPEARVPEAAR